MASVLVGRWLPLLFPVLLLAQPKPGDIIREFSYTSDMIVEFDSGSKHVFGFPAGPQVCHSIDWGIYRSTRSPSAFATKPKY
jgi:hypothetical protein